MGIFDLFKFSPFSKIQTKSKIKTVTPYQQSFDGDKFNLLAEMGFKYNASVNSAVSRIGNAIIQMVLEAKNKRTDKVLEDHPLQKLLNRPFIKTSQGDWLERIFGYYNIAGDSYILIRRRGGNPKGEVIALEPINPSEVEVLTTGKGANEIITGYKIEGEGHRTTKDIIHLKTFNPFSNVLGLSPLFACGYSVDIDNSSKKWNVSVMNNGLNPSGVYNTDIELNDKPYYRLKKEIQEKDSGFRNAGKSLLLDAGLKFTQTGLNPKDLDFLNAQKYSKKEVASVYNIAPLLIGDTDSSTYNNVREAKLDLHNDTAFPMLKSYVEALNILITPLFGNDVYISINFDGVKALEEDRNSLWSRIDASTELTINEKRTAKGFEAIKGGDVIINDGQTLQQIITRPALSLPKAKETPLIRDVEIKEVPEIYIPENFNNFLAGTFKDPSKKHFALFEHKVISQGRDDAIEESVRAVRKFFKAESKLLSEAFAKASNLDEMNSIARSVLLQNAPEWFETYDKIYKDIALHYAVKSGVETSRVRKEVAVSFDLRKKFQTEWNEIVDDYYKEIKLGEMIVDLQAVSLSAVETTIINGGKDGKSIFQVSKDIQKLYKNDQELWRAERIARTETMRATNYSQLEVHKKVDPERLKSWLPTNDSRTRGSDDGDRYNHLTADKDNGWKAMSDLFFVSGDDLLFPCDVSNGADAGNTINCRCDMLFADRDDIF